MIEQRAAQFALARADRELKHVESIVERLAALRNEMDVAGGATTGSALAAMAETKLRLASASRAAARPLMEASQRRQEKHAVAMTAHRKADGAESLLQKTSVSAAKADAIRADANRIARRSANLGEEI